MTGAVQWSELTVIVSAICGAGTVVGGVLIWLWGRYASLLGRIGQIEINVVKSQLLTAQEFVTRDALTHVEDRLSRSIDKLGDRLEMAMSSLLHAMNGTTSLQRAALDNIGEQLSREFSGTKPPSPRLRAALEQVETKMRSQD